MTVGNVKNFKGTAFFFILAIILLASCVPDEGEFISDVATTSCLYQIIDCPVLIYNDDKQLYFYVDGYGMVDEEAYVYISRYGLTGAASMGKFRPDFARLDWASDTFYITISEDFASYVYTIKISDSIYLRLIYGSFPGASEYFGREAICPTEDFIYDFLSRSYPPIKFYDLTQFPSLILVFNKDIEEFRFVALCHIPGDDRNYNFINDVLLSIDTLKSNQPFITNWVSQGHEPTRGIAFYDEDSNFRVFSFTENNVGGYWPPLTIRELFLD